MSRVVSGWATYLAYGYENTFGTAAGTYNKAFSQGVKITTFDVDNAPDYVYGLGSQDLQASVAKEFKGAFSLEFNLSDPWWLQSILGGTPVTSGGGPYTHAWSGLAGITNTQSGLTLDVGTDLDTDSRQLLTGCIVNSANISANVNEPVKVKLDGWYSGITKSTTLGTEVLPVEQPLEFQHASVVLSGSTLIDVQSSELTLTRNNDPVYALGSRFPQNNVPKTREWSVRLKQTYESDAALWDHVLGTPTGPNASPQTIPTFVMTVANGLTGTNERQYKFTFAGLFVEKGSLPMSVDDTTMVDVSMRAKNLSGVTVINNISNAL